MSVRLASAGDESSGIESAHGLSDPPELGADTLGALSAAGFELAEIARLRAANVVHATGS